MKAERLTQKQSLGKRDLLRAYRHVGPANGLPTDRTVNGWLMVDTRTVPLAVDTPSLIQLVDSKTVVPDRVEPVTLRMYTPGETEALCPLVQSFVGDSTMKAFALLSDKEQLAKREEIRKSRYLAAHPEVPKKVYDKGRELKLEYQRKELKQRINKRVYELVMAWLGKSTLEEAADAFEHERQQANNAIRDHVNLVYSGDVGLDLQNEVSLRQRPADLLELALTTDNPRLRFEIQRQFLDTVIALRHEKARSREADDKLTQIQTLMNEKFYAGEAGATTQVVAYGLFDDKTNKLAENYPTFAKPDSPAPEGKHYKELKFPVRELQTGEQVLTLIGTKTRGSAIRKALRKAQERADEGKDDTVQVEKDVQDTHRMKIVVLSDQEGADRVANELFELLTDKDNHEYFYNKDVLGNIVYNDLCQPTGVPTGRGEVKTNNRGGAGQKPVNWTKLLIEFDGVTNPIEVVIQPLSSFITEQLEVGKYDPEKGEFTGSAHEIYTLDRERRNKVYVPTTIYEVTHPSQVNKDIVPDALNTKAEELLTRRKIVIEEVA